MIALFFFFVKYFKKFATTFVVFHPKIRYNVRSLPLWRNHDTKHKQQMPSQFDIDSGRGYTMQVAYFTLGCKVNQYETEAIRELLETAGYQTCDPEDTPDIILINSCTVTAESDRKTRQLTRKYKGKYPTACLILIGCMVQAFPDAAEALPEADVILGNRDPSLVLEKMEQFLATRNRVICITPHQKEDTFRTPGIRQFAEHTRAFLKIQDGCERYCSYCIIPKARGFLRSQTLPSIRAQAEALADSGYQELVLVGINLSSYGKELNLTLADAVEAVAKVPSIQRIRLGSLEPDLMTDDECMRLAAEEKFCPQFHLALQAGNDNTLRRMNRHYDTAFFADLVERIHKHFDNPAITTDIMVGFPGETNDDFQASVDFVEQIGFARCHVFPYSRRQGTIAAALPDQIPRAEKNRRASQMIEAAAQAEKRFLQSQVGKTVQVLLETWQDGILSGYSENYTLVKIPGNRALCNTIQPVLLTDTVGNACIGTLLC